MDVKHGEYAVLTEVFAVESVFNYLSQVLTPITMKKKINLNFVLDNQNIQLKSDKNIIHKVLLNVISNSIKFSKEGSKILVGVQDLDNEFVEFIVQDEGIGILNSNIAYIFDKLSLHEILCLRHEIFYLLIEQLYKDLR